MEKREKIKAIIFDIGGVLYLNSHISKKPKKKHCNLGVHEKISKKLKIDLDSYFDAIDTSYVKSISGEFSEKKVISIISKNLKVSERKLIYLYKKVYQEEFSLNKQLFKQAIALKRKGYKIAILSDQWHLSKKALVPKKLINLFNEAVISCDVKLRKPDKKIYKLILKKLKIKPFEAIFIDNREWNLKPAKKLGMKTILFQDNFQTMNDLNKILQKGAV